MECVAANCLTILSFKSGLVLVVLELLLYRVIIIMHLSAIRAGIDRSKLSLT
jgi:hypothetical protein